MKRDDLFPELEPPPGGLSRLRRRIDEAERRHARNWKLVLVAVSAPAVAGLVLAIARPQPKALAPELSEARLMLGTSRAPVEPVAMRDPEAAAERVATSNPQVVFYWVGSAAAPR